MTSLNVTPAKQWSRTVKITLPSGNVAEIRALDIGAFIRLGRIPDTLTPIIELLWNGDNNALRTDTTDEKMRVIEFLNAICMSSFVNPKVIDGEPDYERGEISLDDLTMEDKQAIMALFNAPAQMLERFREEQKNDVEPVRDLQDNPDAPLDLPGDQEVGKRSA